MLHAARKEGMGVGAHCNGTNSKDHYICPYIGGDAATRTPTLPRHLRFDKWTLDDRAVEYVATVDSEKPICNQPREKVPAAGMANCLL